jgi:hypothetical protein
VELTNHSEEPATISVDQQDVFDDEGELVEVTATPLTVEPGETVTVDDDHGNVLLRDYPQIFERV